MTEFGTLDLEELEGEGARMASSGGQGGGASQGSDMDKYVQMPKVKAGQKANLIVRILPPMKGNKLYQYTRIHTINGRKYHCPRPLVGGKYDWKVPCPICEYYRTIWNKLDKLKKEGKEKSEEYKKLHDEQKAIRPAERYYYNCIVRKLVTEKGEQFNVGPKILSVGIILHKKIISAITGDPNDETIKRLGNVTDPKTGYDFVIRLLGQGGEENYPKYDDSSFLDAPSVLGTPEEVKAWTENLHDLTTLRVIKGVDILEKELAKHLGFIPKDDPETFSVDALAAKYQNKGTVAAPAPVQDADAALDAVVGGGAVADHSALEEDLSITDAGFMDSIAEAEAAMKG